MEKRIAQGKSAPMFNFHRDKCTVYIKGRTYHALLLIDGTWFVWTEFCEREGLNDLHKVETLKVVVDCMSSRYFRNGKMDLNFEEEYVNKSIIRLF